MISKPYVVTVERYKKYLSFYNQYSKLILTEILMNGDKYTLSSIRKLQYHDVTLRTTVIKLHELNDSLNP